MNPTYKETQVSAFQGSFGRPHKLAFGLGLFAMLALTALFISRSVPVAGAAESFPGQGFLPDDRAWELVSPPDKNGGEVIASTRTVQAADTGGAVQFSALTGFADPVGAGIGFQYVARRTAQPGTQGWLTHAITPPQSGSGTFFTNTHARPHYMGELSDDLDQGIFYTAFALNDADANVSRVANLWVRSGLATPGAASAAENALATPCPSCAAPFTALTTAQGQTPTLAETSEDFSKLTFISPLNLTSDATGTRAKLYKWDANSGVSLQGLIPPGGAIECTGSDCLAAVNGSSSRIGTGNTAIDVRPSYSRNALSSDGSRAVFYSPATSAGGSCDGACSLYLRDDQGNSVPDDDTTVKVNASERTVCADDPNDPSCGTESPDPAPDPGGAKAAIYQDATPDGDYVFFTTEEALTDDAALDPPNKDLNLYRYNATQPASAADNLTLVHDDASGEAGAGLGVVFGTSHDGETAYFSAGPQGRHLYRWREGTAEQIGQRSALESGPQVGTPHLTSWTSYEYASRVSTDGRYLTFVTNQGHELTGYDHGSACQVEFNFFEVGTGDDPCEVLYLYDAEADGGGAWKCASCKPSGASPTTNTIVAFHQGINSGGMDKAAHISTSLTDDGKAFFSTGDRLVPEDTNGAFDAYVYDPTKGRAELLSSGTDPSGSYFLDASEDGSDVFIATRERLSAWDTDDAFDVYDARQGGGFPEPEPEALPCLGNQQCKGEHTAPPDGTDLGSGSLGSEGNPAADGPTDCSAQTRKVSKTKRKLQKARKRARRSDRRRAERRLAKAKRKHQVARRQARSCGNRGQS